MAHDRTFPVWLHDLQHGRRKAKERAFESFLDAWHERIYHCHRRMLGNHEDAADATQETLVQVFNSAAQFAHRSAFSTWVYTIATRKALDALERRKRQRTLSFEEAYLERERALEADPLFDGDETARQLHAAIEALPSRQNQVFVLRYFEELPYSEIAEMTGISEGSLKASYHHAVAKIKSQVILALT